jgi:short-subunit dehydrogenase
VYHVRVSGRGRTALVTGASAGIGAAFARLLAAEGFDLVLVARRRSRLETLAKELERAHGVTAHVVAADLADSAAPREIHATLQSRSIPVDVLVNNAGYGLREGFAAARWQQHAEFIQVMATSLTELCHLFAASMRERGWGRILNVSSVAAFSPAVAGSLYGGIKAYGVGFSQALGLELEGTGVNVCALCPGYTLSEFHDVIDVRDQIDALPRFLVMTAETVARQGWQAVQRGDPICIPGWIYRLICCVCRLAPPSMLRVISRRSVLRPKR